jgi:hypothetical protein
MLVETYECQETASEPIEACQEAVEIMEKLGLAGQKELLRKDELDVVRRLPYREMTADEQFVYGMLCPVKAKLKDYRSSPIPLRVLQVAAHAEQAMQFRELIVWDRGTAAEKDPVLVGMKPSEIASQREYSWYDRPFILARWGDELEAFVVLLKRACDAKREQLCEQVRSLLAGAAGIEGRISAMTTAQIIRAGIDAECKLIIPNGLDT